MPASDEVFLGIDVGGESVHVSSSVGQRSAISAQRLRAPADWIELATYGLQLPDSRQVLACVAVAAGTPPARSNAIVRAARLAGWDGVLVVNALNAAGRSLQARWGEVEELALVVVDSRQSSVGLLRGDGLLLVDHDHVQPIAGREVRELAVSLRCLLKQRPRAEVRRLLRRVVVAGNREEIERLGPRRLRAELEGLGAEQVELLREPFLLADGAKRIARETERSTWRRLRRR